MYVIHITALLALTINKLLIRIRQRRIVIGSI